MSEISIPFYSLKKVKGSIQISVPSITPHGRRDTSLLPSLKDEEIHLFILLQEKKYKPYTRKYINNKP